MKNFFTWFFAVLLLSLCLLEKEAKKNAILMEKGNQNLVRINKSEPDVIVNQNLSPKREFQDNINMVVSDRTNVVNSRSYVATDSLSFL